MYGQCFPLASRHWVSRASAVEGAMHQPQQRRQEASATVGERSEALGVDIDTHLLYLLLLDGHPLLLTGLVLQDGGWEGAALFEPRFPTSALGLTFSPQKPGQLLQLRLSFCPRIGALLPVGLRDDLRLLVAETHVIGGHAVAGVGTGQRDVLLILAELQIEELPVLLDVVQPFWLQVAGEEQRDVIGHDIVKKV